jgi:hypothetical protein
MVKEGYEKVKSPESSIHVNLCKLMSLCVLVEARFIQDCHSQTMDGADSRC